MTAYGDFNGNSGIAYYELGVDDMGNAYMDIEYASGGTYRYYKHRVGAANFEEMISLAKSGSGLNGFLNSIRKCREEFRPTAPVAPVAKETVNVKLDTPDAVTFISELARRYNVRISFND